MRTYFYQIYLFITIFTGPLICYGAFVPPAEWGKFSGTVLSLSTNPQNGILRVKFDFTNRKFLIKGDKVEFYSQNNNANPCIGRVMEKGIKEILIKVHHLDHCILKNPFRIGSVLDFYSQDLIDHIKTAQDVLEILKKKKMALTSKVTRIKNELNGYMDKLSATNEKYTQQTQLIEQQWSKELTQLEEQKLQFINELKDIELRIFDVDLKMEQYFYKDKNWDLDQWSLDQRQAKKIPF